MIIERINLPDGIIRLMEKLWLNYHFDNNADTGKVFVVNLPKPTEEEKRIMAANRADRKPIIIDGSELNVALQKASEKLGGW